MDWIRLGSSGKDLTGVGSAAGSLSITLTELKQHDRVTDGWLAIRGKVYNVTEYMNFHPGGVEELMRGVGKDATNLFDEVGCDKKLCLFIFLSFFVFGFLFLYF